MVTSRLFPPLDPGKFSWVMTDVVQLSSPDNGAATGYFVVILLVLHHNSVDREMIVSFIGGALSIRLSETGGLRHDVCVEPRHVLKSWWAYLRVSLPS